MLEGDALIRAHLHLDPDTLTDEEWVAQVHMALWIEHRYFQNLSKLFGG